MLDALECASNTRDQNSSGWSAAGSPEGTKIALRAWESSWVRGWLAEFFCDLFAAFTVGPAFAWSHLHLVLKRGSDPYAIPAYVASSHPADDARMTTVLHALTLSGFSAQALQIRSAWCSCMSALGYRAEPEYELCFPNELLLVYRYKGV